MRTLVTLAALALTVVLAAPAAAAPRHAPYDFDDDGRQDIVAGIPGWSASFVRTGAFALFGAAGLHRPPRVINQSTRGVPDFGEDGDRMGLAVAGGDFDGNGFADLAVATPYEGSNSSSWGGAVTVFRGSASGLIAAGAREIAGPGTDRAEFGMGLAAGDLNRDGYADLVVGAPNDAPTARASGAMYVFFGGRAGLDAAHPRRLARPRSNDAHFGQHIALGDFNGDHRLDVAEAGSGSGTYEKPIRRQSAWCRGGAQGPISCRHLTRSRTPLAPVSIAAGDVTGDGRADMVEGLVSYWRGEKGAILLRKGGGHGPRAGRVYSQSSPGVTGHTEVRDQFGRSVAIGDLNRDGHADVVVGSPGEDLSAGRIVILRGTSGGLSRHHVRTLSQRDRGVPGRKARDHSWGRDMTLLRIDRDPHLDLITDTFDRSIFEVPGGRHGLVFRRTDDFNLRRLGHRGPNDAPAWVGLGLGH